jgi:hypothetical protein
MPSAISHPPPTPLRTAQILLLINALVWIGVGISSLVDFPLEEAYAGLLWVLVGLMFANALLFLAVAWGIGRGNRPLFWLGVAQVTVNLVLSVTDQVGFFDVLVLLLNAALLALLFAQRKQFGVRW